MRKTILTICICCLYAISISQTATITLKVVGVESIKGNMSIAMYNNPDDFMGKESFILGIDVPVETNTFEYTLNDISFGTYAIAIYHDIDMNGKLNTNWIGMPKEPFGFSNDARGKFGPPDYEDAVFELSGDSEIIINLLEL